MAEAAQSAESVRVPASHLLRVLRLIGECIEDLAEDEQVVVEELDYLLRSQAPVTYQAHWDRNNAIGEFYQVAIEGGLMRLGPPAQSDGGVT